MCQESSPDSFRLSAALCGGSLSAPPWQPLIEASLPVAKGWDVLEQKNPGDPSLSVPLPVPTHPGRLSEQPKCMHGLCCFCRSLSVSTSSSTETSSTAAGLNWTRSAFAVFSTAVWRRWDLLVPLDPREERPPDPTGAGTLPSPLLSLSSFY